MILDQDFDGKTGVQITAVFRHLFFEKDPSTNGDGLSKKVFRERTMGVEHGGREGGSRRIERGERERRGGQKRKEG